MKRADALKALDDACAERLGLLFKVLADGFQGSRDDRDGAKEHFEIGLSQFADAETFAREKITEKIAE